MRQYVFGIMALIVLLFLAFGARSAFIRLTTACACDGPTPPALTPTAQAATATATPVPNQEAPTPPSSQRMSATSITQALAPPPLTAGVHGSTPITDTRTRRGCRAVRSQNAGGIVVRASHLGTTPSPFFRRSALETLISARDPRTQLGCRLSLTTSNRGSDAISP
jgi:hypothetical protein